MRRILVAAVLVALALLVQVAVPGPSTRLAPFQAIGVDGAAIGDVAVEVHDVVAAESIEVDGEVIEASGVFVVVDATYGVSGEAAGVARELVIGQTVYTPTDRGPDIDDDAPAAGLPVRGDTVFEVDPALVGTVGAGVLQLRVTHAVVPSGDLASQAVALVEAPEAVLADPASVMPLESLS